MEEVVDPQCRLVDVESRPQLHVLCGNAHRAAAGVAVVALAGRHADSALVVGHTLNVLVAVQRHQGGGAQGHGLGAQRQTLGHVTTVANTTGHHEVDLIGQTDVLKRPSGLGDCRHQRDTRLLGSEVWTGAGSALGSIQVDGVRTALGGHPDVVVDPSRAQLQLDRDLVVSGLPYLLDL